MSISEEMSGTRQGELEPHANLRFSWDDLPAITAHLPGTGGELRACLDDFAVSEIPSYLPSGDGAHAYAHVEKRGLTTLDIVSALTQHGVPRRSVGYAGLKDKHAVTRQWLSVPAEYSTALEALDAVGGVTLLETALHRNKLGLGHLRGNRFSLRVRNPSADWQQPAEAILTCLRRVGLPNYFGPQRFGYFNTNIADGLRLIDGERMSGDRRIQRFFLSAFQSHLFNLLLKKRIERGLYDAVLSGDRAQKHDTGGMFVVEDAASESERSRLLEISATLPLFGKKVRLSEGNAGSLEAELLSEFRLQYARFRIVQGARRISRIRLDDAAITPAPNAYILDFTLPKGAYATALMRELMKTADVR